MAKNHSTSRISLLLHKIDHIDHCIEPFTERQNFTLVQIESICRRQDTIDSKTEIGFVKGRKHFGKRRKCWLPAFSSFRKMFSKASFLIGYCIELEPNNKMLD